MQTKAPETDNKRQRISFKQTNETDNSPQH